MSERKDYSTFSKILPKVTPDGESLKNLSSTTINVDKHTISKQENKTDNGDFNQLNNLKNTKGISQNPNQNLSAPKSSFVKAQREKDAEIAMNFGGENKELSACEPNSNAVFMSRTVQDKKRREQEENFANQSVINHQIVKTKGLPESEIETFSQKVVKEAKAAKEAVFETITTAFDHGTPYSEEKKIKKRQKAIEYDKKLLSGDNWFNRNGHAWTYLFLLLFTATVYFRPYEWVDYFKDYTSMALFFAVLTLIFYLPTQLNTESNLTIPTTEIKCVIFLGAWSIATFPIAKNPSVVWGVWNEVFIKILIVFVVMVNALRTKERMKGLMWLSISVGVMLSYQALKLYSAGEFSIEGYRVNPDFGGMFGNPNDTALHLVIFMPIAFALGLSTKNILAKVVYFGSVAMMVSANFVLQSRGGFLGMIAVAGFFVWKLSRNNRLLVVGASLLIGFAVITFAPGNYWLRIASIFDPSLDPVGSSDQRRELLERSIQVTLRNPLGIGLGCFPIVGIRDLQTHNAFTQVSSELGWLGLFAYVTFLLSPFRKLGAMERQLFGDKENKWMYYLTLGLQASIIGYMVSSFFVSVAYQWFVYFPIAYAVALRRIYKLQQEKEEKMDKPEEVNEKGTITGWITRDEFSTAR